MARIYSLFLSHSWTYDDAYDRLCELLDGAFGFEYRDFSVPKDDPVHTAMDAMELYEAIKRPMIFCDAVLIISGVYAPYSKWIDREIQVATRDLGKPVLAIRPWGNERTSPSVEQSAAKVVGWSTREIVSGIREVAP